MEKRKIITTEAISNATLEIQLVSVVDAYNMRWKDNAKQHDIGALTQMIEKHGFRDPSAYDKTLDAIIAGNGRIEAVYKMYKNGYNVPKGIHVDDNGMWYIPVLYGIDSENQNKAISYAIDHNNSTMMGGDFNAYDMARMWDENYLSLLSVIIDSEDSPLSIDRSSYEMLCTAVESNDGVKDTVNDDKTETPIVVLLQELQKIKETIEEKNMLNISETQIRKNVNTLYTAICNFINISQDLLR